MITINNYNGEEALLIEAVKATTYYAFPLWKRMTLTLLMEP